MRRTPVGYTTDDDVLMYQVRCMGGSSQFGSARFYGWKVKLEKKKKNCTKMMMLSFVCSVSGAGTLCITIRVLSCCPYSLLYTAAVLRVGISHAIG